MTRRPKSRASIELAPGSSFNPYAELVNIYRQRGEFTPMVTLLQQWLEEHPEDGRIREYLTAVRASAATRANP